MTEMGGPKIRICKSQEGGGFIQVKDYNELPIEGVVEIKQAEN